MHPGSWSNESYYANIVRIHISDAIAFSSSSDAIAFSSDAIAFLWMPT
jgi:hypothetical protein